MPRILFRNLDSWGLMRGPVDLLLLQNPARPHQHHGLPWQRQENVFATLKRLTPDGARGEVK